MYTWVKLNFSPLFLDDNYTNTPSTVSFDTGYLALSQTDKTKDVPFPMYVWNKTTLLAIEVTDLPNNMFENNICFTHVVIPRLITGNAVFKNCIYITTMSQGSAVNVPTETFMGCVRLGNVDISNAINVGTNAFTNCNSM